MPSRLHYPSHWDAPFQVENFQVLQHCQRAAFFDGVERNVELLQVAAGGRGDERVVVLRAFSSASADTRADTLQRTVTESSALMPSRSRSPHCDIHKTSTLPSVVPRSL